MDNDTIIYLANGFKRSILRNARYDEKIARE